MTQLCFRSFEQPMSWQVRRPSRNTGCAITPYSALSQASCWRPDDQKGFGLLPEEVEVYFGETLHEKSPAEAAVATVLVHIWGE
jgi:hypothetical protein